MKNKDLTHGNVFKLLLLFSLPMVLSVTLQQLYNICDNYIAGHLITNLDSFNAVGIVYPITVVFLDIAIGFGVGAGVICSRFFGAKDKSSLKRCVTTGMIAMSVLAIITTVLGLAFMKLLLKAMVDTKNGMGCFNEAYSYMMIYTVGVIFLFIYNFSMYIFQSMGNSKTPLYFLLFSTILNIIFDIFFIKVFNMNAVGLALGTVISEAIAAILSIVVLMKNINKINSNKEKLFDKAILSSILKVAIPSILQGSFISIGGVLVTTILTNFGGNAVVGGYSAAYKVTYIAINVFTVLGNALSSFISQNIGANKYDRIYKGYFSTVILCLAFALLSTLIILPFRRFWVEMFIKDPNATDVDIIIDAGMTFILSVVPYFFLMVIKLPIDGVMKGTCNMGLFMIGTSTDLVTRVVVAYFFGKYLGYKQVFYAWPIGWAVGAIFAFFFFIFGTWKKKCGYPKKIKNTI